MALTGNGTDGVVSTVSAITPPNRYTFHFWYQNASSPGTGTVDKPFSISDGAADYDVSFCWDHTSSPRTLFHRRSGGTYDQAVIPAGILTSSTWYGIGGRYDGSNLTVFVDGTSRVSVSATDPVTSVSPTPSALAGSAGTANFDDGTIAEVAMWNVALTDAEMLSLGRKFTPDQVRPESLVLYWPLIRDIVALFGTVTSTGGLTVATHPPIIEAQGGFTTRHTANATYGVECSGGIAMSGTSTVAPDFVQECSGGISMAGTSVIEIGVGVTTGMNLSSGADRTHIRTGVTITATPNILDLFGNASSQMFLSGQARANSGELANGRFKERLD